MRSSSYRIYSMSVTYINQVYSPVVAPPSSAPLIHSPTQTWAEDEAEHDSCLEWHLRFRTICSRSDTDFYPLHNGNFHRDHQLSQNDIHLFTRKPAIIDTFSNSRSVKSAIVRESSSFRCRIRPRISAWDASFVVN